MDNFKSPSAKAWRVVLISAINYAQNNNFFTFDPINKVETRTFEMLIVGIYPALVRMHDAGFDEVGFECKVIVRKRMITCIGWVERRTARHLQRSESPVPNIRPNRGVEIHELAGFNEFVFSEGYSDAGPMFI